MRNSDFLGDANNDDILGDDDDHNNGEDDHNKNNQCKDTQKIKKIPFIIFFICIFDNPIIFFSFFVFKILDFLVLVLFFAHFKMLCPVYRDQSPLHGQV